MCSLVVQFGAYQCVPNILRFLVGNEGWFRKAIRQRRIVLKDVPVSQDDVLGWQVVGVIGYDCNRPMGRCFRGVG